MKTNRIVKQSTFVLLLSLLFLGVSSCGFYSFTGASIHPEAKTVSVAYFPNNASLVNPTLSDIFTESLKDKFANQTRLRLVSNGGDLSFEGEITDYSVTPQAITGDQTAALNRLTIKVKVTYVNILDEKDNFKNKTFSFYSDYDASNDFSSVEESLIQEITEAIIEDIFNQAVVNW